VIRSVSNYCHLSICVAIEGNADGETNCQLCNPRSIADTLVSLDLLRFPQMKLLWFMGTRSF